MNKLYRILDANINRVSEGIRVLEDYSRFYLNISSITRDLRSLRHKIRDNLSFMDLSLINSRDPINDPGKTISQITNVDARALDKHLIISNFKRVQEGIRSIEETLKVIDMKTAKAYELLRFESYDLEKRFQELIKKQIPQGIYGITSESHSKGRNNIEVIKHMINGGVRIIQYREKNKKQKEVLAECREIRKITMENNIVFIINDYIDIAMMVDADGVHIGQDDIPLKEARAILGNKIIGVSTHSPEQANQAIDNGADYIGVGPIFPTNTKEDVCPPVGFKYLDWIIKNTNIPFVAIGGIKSHNINQISRKGAKTIALVTEIVSSDDIESKIRKLSALMAE